ncbi:MAG: hypothetical protein R2784_13540 [Saprospiraceae bacterium]
MINQRGLDWIASANRKYKIMMGEIWSETNVTYTFNLMAQHSQRQMHQIAQEMVVIVDVQYNHTFHSEPPDGVVIRSSAAGFPGANHVKLMPGSNHQQMRNDSNTEKEPTNLYNGSCGTFFKVDTRY